MNANESDGRKNGGAHKNERDAGTECGSVESAKCAQMATECKKRIQDWIAMAILAYHTIGHAVLDTRSACESRGMIKLSERVNDDLIRKNNAAIKELVARKVNVIELEMEMTACMNANEISGMMDVVTSMTESNA